MHGSPPARVGTVTMIKAPVERALAWAAYHLNSGIDEMHLFFDDPADPAVEVLQDLPGVRAYRCDDRFWTEWGPTPVARPESVSARQNRILRGLLLNPPQGLDWAIHIDSDELLWAADGLRPSLDRDLSRGCPHVQFLPLEAVPPHGALTDPFTEIVLFKDPVVDRAKWAKRLGAGGAFQRHRFLRGHVKGKPAVRLDGSIAQMRIHGPTDGYRRLHPFATWVSDSVRLLHYDAMSYQEWRDKWRWRLRQPRSNATRARRRQQVRFRRALRARDGATLRLLYQQEYLLTTWQARVLRLLGMVRRIDIPPELFRPAPAPPRVDIPRQRTAAPPTRVR